MTSSLTYLNVALFSLILLFKLNEMPLFLRGLLDLAERRLQVQLGGACLTRSPSPPTTNPAAAIGSL